MPRDKCLFGRHIAPPRRNKKPLLLKGIGRQNHAVAPRIAPDLIPIRLDPGSPEPANDAQEMGVILGLVLRMPERTQHLTGFDRRLHPRQRAERLARPDLKEHPIGFRPEMAQAIVKPHRVAQLSDPILRVGRLLGTQRLTV